MEHNIGNAVKFYNDKLVEYVLSNKEFIDSIITDAIESGSHGLKVKSSYVDRGRDGKKSVILQYITYHLVFEDLPGSRELPLIICLEPSATSINGVVFVEGVDKLVHGIETRYPEIYAKAAALMKDLVGVAVEVLCPTFFGVNPEQVDVNKEGVNSTEEFSGVYCSCEVNVAYLKDNFGDLSDGAFI